MVVARCEENVSDRGHLRTIWVRHSPAISGSMLTRGEESRKKARGRTHHLQTPPRQYPLSRRRDTASIPLEVPHDVAPVQLRKHLCYLLHLRRVDDSPTPAACCFPWSVPARAAISVQEPSNHKERNDREGEERWNIERRFFIRHVGTTVCTEVILPTRE